MRKVINWRGGVLASFALFSAGILAGMNFWFSHTEQWRNYQMGLMAYHTTLYQTAVEYFDVSYAEYQRMLTEKQGPLVAPPSLELAELSQHFKGVALVAQGTEASTKLAVVTFKEGLKLTTKYALKDSGLDEKMIAKIQKDRTFTQQDLEILFHNKPKQAQGEGKGRGQPQPGDKQSEDPTKSGNPAGKEDREKL